MIDKSSSREPYISVLRLFTESGQAHISPVAEIKDASHVLLLEGPLLGYAVRNGDDTMPYLENWETCENLRFVFPSDIEVPSSTIEAHNPGKEHVSCLLLNGIDCVAHGDTEPM